MKRQIPGTNDQLVKDFIGFIVLMFFFALLIAWGNFDAALSALREFRL